MNQNLKQAMRILESELSNKNSIIDGRKFLKRIQNESKRKFMGLF